LRDSDLVLPEGALRYCPACGQLLSACTEAQYISSNREWDTEAGTWPSARDMQRLRKRRSQTVRLVARMLAKPYADMRLLDVGCSSGAAVWIAREMGVDAEGVEPTAQPVAKARELGLKVHQGLLHEVAFPDSSFDVITLFEVIEHLDQPAALLRECRRILRPGGILVVGTGNTLSWTRMLRGRNWDFFDMREHGGHINFFSYKSIAVLAAATGFRVAQVRTNGVKLHQKEELPHLLYRLSKVLAELLSIPARLLQRGHQMEAYLVSLKRGA
jgi:2-polyprenyl-3-methyl-5-hydroxy-6-metoxy-1,4-benzoquinol methylase